jgi:hypothetical protein
MLSFQAKTIQTKFDASTLHSNQQLAAETQMFDDGSGRVEVSSDSTSLTVGYLV